MKALKVIAIGIVVVVIVFLFSIGVGVFLGTNKGVKNYVESSTAQKEAQRQEALQNMSEEDIAKMNELYDKLNENNRQSKIKAAEADGTKIVITLPAFKNSSVEDADYVCKKDLPADFKQQVAIYKQMVVDGKFGYENLMTARPECYKEGGFFDYSIGACADIREEHVWALILGLSKRVVESHNGTQSGKYEFFHYEGIELQNKTLGVIGFGDIGSKVASISRAFNMKVLAFNRSAKVATDVDFVSLEELLQKSDVIAVTLPYTSETEKFISEAELEIMKKGAILVSISRENVIDQAALIKYLDNGKLFGVGLELDINKSANNAFYKYSNVIITPHTAFFTKESEQKSNDLAVENVEMFVKGTPQNIIN